MALKDIWNGYDYRRRVEAIIAKKQPRKVNGKDRPWRLIDSRRTKSGYEYAFHVPLGYSSQDLEKQIDAFYASVGAHVEIKNRAGVVVVAVYTTELPDEIPFGEGMLELTNGRAVLLGFDIDGNPAFHSFKIPHMLIAGQSGYGKTDLIRWILFQIIAHIPPEFVEIDIIDMKKFSFIPFKGIPHIRRIATDLESAVDVLDDAFQTMNERADLVWDTGDRSLVDTFKWRIVLIDEASQISPDIISGKQEKALASIAASRAASISCVGREASVGLLYATQYPTAKVINGQIKANMEAVCCFKVENDVHSNVALDFSGAEKIPVPGRAIYKSRGQRTTIQVPYVGKDSDWDRLLAPYATGGGNYEVGKQARDTPTDDENSAGDFDLASGEIL